MQTLPVSQFLLYLYFTLKLLTEWQSSTWDDMSYNTWDDISYSTVLIKLLVVNQTTKQLASPRHMGECSLERDERGITWDIPSVPWKRPGHFNDVWMTERGWTDVYERKVDEILQGGKMNEADITEVEWAGGVQFGACGDWPLCCRAGGIYMVYFITS